MAYYIQGKGWFESSGAPMGSKRKINLEIAKQCGFNNDTAAFTRLRIESRIGLESLQKAWGIGQEMRQKWEQTNTPKFKTGDKVTLVNDYGCVFIGKTIIGIDPTRIGICYYLEPIETPWFAFPERNLRPSS